MTTEDSNDPIDPQPVDPNEPVRDDSKIQTALVQFLGSFWQVGGFFQGLDTSFEVSFAHARQIATAMTDDQIRTNASFGDFVSLLEDWREVRKLLTKLAGVEEDDIRAAFQELLGTYADINDLITGGRIIENPDDPQRSVPPGLLIRSIDARKLLRGDILMRTLGANAILALRRARADLISLLEIVL